LVNILVIDGPQFIPWKEVFIVLQQNEHPSYFTSSIAYELSFNETGKGI